jgi:hypothetical protein
MFKPDLKHSLMVRPTAFNMPNVGAQQQAKDANICIMKIGWKTLDRQCSHQGSRIFGERSADLSVFAQRCPCDGACDGVGPVTQLVWNEDSQPPWISHQWVDHLRTRRVEECCKVVTAFKSAQ